MQINNTELHFYEKKMLLPQMYIAHRQPVQKDSLFKALIVKLQTLF